MRAGSDWPDRLGDPMKLTRLKARRYRSVRNDTIDIGSLNLLIGANAAGKSNVLDALRFLHEGAVAGDFGAPMHARGGIVHLAWKGEQASHTGLTATVLDEETTYEWSVSLVRDGYEFSVDERLTSQGASKGPPASLLESSAGSGWWWSDQRRKKVPLKQDATACALAAAAADASFEAREVAEFIRRWGFFDPSPFLLRRDWGGLDSERFDPHGRNLARTLHKLRRSSPETFKNVVAATRSVLGLPSDIEPRESDNGYYFVQWEQGLGYPVHQMGVSSGTLRMLALMTALLTEPRSNLIGIEEPENYVHPSALRDFAQHLLQAKDRVQFVVTTHSPLLLDFLDDPAAVRVVQRGPDNATAVLAREDPDGIRRALDESGFGLGEYYETRGFGAQ